MSSSKLTLIGFYQYFQKDGNDLFSKLNINPDVDKETLISTILLNYGECEVLYGNPYFLQNAIGVWGVKYERTINRLVNAFSIDYNPLENYDRMEDYTDTQSGTNSNNTNASNLNKVSAFNSNVMQDNNLDSSDANSRGAYDNTATHTARLHGNIGVTTSQQMLEAELDIAKRNIYDELSLLFASDFVIGIY